MTQNDSPYIPAFGLDGLTPYYDAFARLVNPFRHRLLDLADIQPGQRVLDLGCGTGLLTIMIKQAVPGSNVTGLDGDAEVLRIARNHSLSADIHWDHALAFDMPYQKESFDVIVSSFVTHHLTGPDKARTFKEVHRVLGPNGSFFILDFGPPFNTFTRIQASVMKRFEFTADNFEGRILPMLRETGFQSVSGAGHAFMFLGPVAFYRAIK